MNKAVRVEKDFLGECTIPADALYGIYTQRGVDNFAISGRLFGAEPDFIRAFALIKAACAAANRDLGVLSSAQARAIIDACLEVVEGRWHDHFIVDLFEGSGGTSLNMNVNEVIANRALVLLGKHPGEHAHLHPNDHVNRSQSTNDVLPSAIKCACHDMVGGLVSALDDLHAAWHRQAEALSDVLRLGRTCLQDAQPMTLGQAFGGYAELVRRLSRQLDERRQDLRVLPLGGTAIGTGLGAPEGFRGRVLNHLAKLTNVEWLPPADAFDALQNADNFVRLSGELRTAALSLAKTANDLVILASGPAGGVGEIRLPALQAGSSIMPGKVNPVQPMTLTQVAFAVAGNDTCVALACQQGQLEINAFEPLIASRLFISLRILTNAIRLFTEKCVLGLEPDRERNERNLMNSAAVATVLTSRFGYEGVAEMVRRAGQEHRPFLELVAEVGGMTSDQARDLVAEAARGTPSDQTQRREQQ
jgi:aspartate ammonia-lyase